MQNFELLFIFIALNIANVIIQTVKSIVTVKCGKTTAALVNAVAYGLYTIVTVYMLCDLPLLWKAGIVAFCNLIGVFVVKFIEENMRKDKLWKIEATLPPTSDKYSMSIALLIAGIPHNFIKVSDNSAVFNIFCKTKEQSRAAKDILKEFNAKYFVSESKIL